MALKKLITSVSFVILCAVLAIAPRTASAQGEEVILATKYLIPSGVFGVDREIMVFLPEGYEGSGQSYPVVYVTRGELYFKDAVAFTSRLALRESMPHVIVVGISHGLDDNPYLIHGSPEADIFLDFLESEVFPFVENTFRTVQNRTIVGWHYTSSLALHALLTKPGLFEGYIVASPFPLQPNKVDLEILERNLADNPERRVTLYFGADPSENFIAEEMKDFEQILAESAPEGLNWHVNNLAADTDRTDTVYRILHPGLREVFRDYGFPRFRDLAAFNEWGGMAKMETFVAARALKYGGSHTISDQTGFLITTLAVGGDDIALFEQAMAMFDILAMDPSVTWYDRFAQFYIQHNELAKAITLYEGTVAKFPPNIGLLASLAGAYEMNAQIAEATAAYEAAISLAESRSDERVTELKEKLAALG